MIRNLIFDWSGTLVDDLGPVVATTNAVLGHYGKGPLTREEFLADFELPYTRFYERFLPEVPIAEVETLYLRHFPRDGGKVVELDGARRLLDAARARGMRLFILTSVPELHWQAQARQVGLEKYFEEVWAAVVDKQEFCGSKVAEIGLVPEETAFVGDMRHDIEAGHAAGLLTVATLTGYECLERLSRAQPHIVVRDLHRLSSVLESVAVAAMQRPIATVGALVFDADDRVLLVRTAKWSGLWGISGGKVERGETCIEALHRETREETGLEITGIRDVCVQDCIEPAEFHHDAHFLLFNYVARSCGGEVVLNDEAEEFRWLTLEEGLAMPLNEPTRILLQRVREEGIRPAT